MTSSMRDAHFLHSWTFIWAITAGSTGAKYTGISHPAKKFPEFLAVFQGWQSAALWHCLSDRGVCVGVGGLREKQGGQSGPQGRHADVSCQVVWSSQLKEPSVSDTSCWGTDSRPCRGFLGAPALSEAVKLLQSLTLTLYYSLPVRLRRVPVKYFIKRRSGSPGMLQPWHTLFTLKSCVFLYFPPLEFCMNIATRDWWSGTTRAASQQSNTPV